MMSMRAFHASRPSSRMRAFAGLPGASSLSNATPTVVEVPVPYGVAVATPVFAAGAALAMGTGARDVCVVDLDADGALDLVTADAGAGLTVRRGLLDNGHPDGSFAAAAYRSRYPTISSRGMNPSGSSPSYGCSGS